MLKITVEELDLLTFFECEPTMLDDGIPWPYNDFAYEYRSDEQSISFAIAPAYKDVRIILKVGESVVYELNAVRISDVVYEKLSGGETLIVDVDERNRLVLSLKPRIFISHIVSERT